MLESLEIDRFKSIQKQKLEFGRVNLFIGGNGAGKSNFLEAIGLLSTSLDQGLRDGDLARKGMRLSPPELMKSAFKNRNLPKTLNLTADFGDALNYSCSITSKEDNPLLRFHSENCTLRGEKQFGRSGNGQTVHGHSIATQLDKTRSMWDQIRAAFDFNAVVEQTFSEFGRYAIYTPQTDFLRGKRGGAVDTPPVGLHGEGLASAVLTMINYLHKYFPRSHRSSTEAQRAQAKFINSALALAFLPDWTTGVKVDGFKPQLVSPEVAEPAENMVYFIDRFMPRKRNTLSAYDSSEGTLFLLFAAVLLAHPDAPRYFALDNVDSALNPRMTRELVQTIITMTNEVHENACDYGPKQVFLTSHNPTSLDAFNLFDDNQRVFIVQRNDKGHSVATRLKPKEGMSRDDWKIAKNGRNLSQLWLEGMLDGALGENKKI